MVKSNKLIIILNVARIQRSLLHVGDPASVATRVSTNVRGRRAETWLPAEFQAAWWAPAARQPWQVRGIFNKHILFLLFNTYTIRILLLLRNSIYFIYDTYQLTKTKQGKIDMMIANTKISKNGSRGDRWISVAIYKILVNV